MPTTRMEMNHRILVPKEICEATGAKLGTRFIWEMQKDGSIRVIAWCKRPAWGEPLAESQGATSEVANGGADVVTKEMDMEETCLNGKGQLTLPASIRKKLGATKGMRFLWGVMPDGTLLVQPKNRSILDMAGMLEPEEGLHVTIDDMNPWV